MPQSTISSLTPAIFVDRDGVLVENRAEYIRKLSHIHIIPAALEACKRITESEYALVVVSNQASVGRRILSLERVLTLNRSVLRRFEKEGVRFAGSYICPHKPDDDCDCRKPRPGMLLTAARELDLDLARSYMVGDNLTDMGAAKAAGLPGILVKTGLGEEQLAKGTYSGLVADDLNEAADYIFSHPR
jgi:histidinol-phosphate phosphatase family protein